jgi:hypothetical protein
MANKCTKAEKEKRLLQVQGWIIDGAQDNFILRQIRNTWNISLVQARKYLKQAYANWLPDERINIENRRAAKIAELKQIKRSMKTEYKGTPAGINAITRVEKLIIKLEDLEPAKKHQVDATVVHTEMTREERDEYIKKMQEKLIKNANV